ncbi:MAG: FemAB family XrtA/PEP-CTERM system-associated protein [Methylococcales bacterium]
MKKNIEIKQLDQQSSEKWDAFVESCPEATFFHKSAWKKVIEKAFGHSCHFLYAEKEGVIEGVLPLGHVKSVLFGNTLISSPFCVYGGIAAVSDDARTSLDNAAGTLARDLGVDSLEMRNQVKRHPQRPRKELYVTFRKALDPNPEENLKAIPRKQRAMVRKGIKAGLVSVIDSDIDRLYDAYAESVRNLGTPVFSKKYFSILKETFGDQCEVLTIENQGELVASVMNFYFRDQVLPYYGGGTAAARRVQGNDFMYWEVMRRAVEKGIKIFDYGRSKEGTGSYRFKKHWGFEPEPLHYEFDLVKATEMPDINPLNPKYRLFISAWQRLPLSISKIVGPWISCNLG